MPWGVAAAAVGSAAIGAAASSSAANTEAHAANNASNLQKSMFDTTQANLSPFMASGVSANSLLSELMGGPAVVQGQAYGSLTDDQRNAAWDAIVKQSGGDLDAARAKFSQLGASGSL